MKSHSEARKSNLLTMADLDLKALAAERLARRAASKPPTSATRTPTHAQRSQISIKQAQRQLLRVHRSIRLAHSFGCLGCIMGLLLLVLCSSWWWCTLLCISGVALGRYGGAWLHRIMPVMWQEGAEPKPKAVSDAADFGIFSLRNISNIADNLQLENQVALENLAFLCTYGKSNCITQRMYSGPLSYGKVVGLVWSKLRDGTVRCM